MGQFKRELGELMHVLQSSGTHFIRCIKPSPKQEPGHWDAPMVLSQLRCSGLMAAVQLMAMGYPCRATYTELFDIFSSMPGLDRLASLGPKNFCTALLMAVEVPRAQMFHGVQRVFLKAGQIGFLERLRSQGATIDQDIIEKVMRFMIRRRWRRGCAAAICALRTQKILHGIALRHRWRRVARIRLAIERKWVATAVRVRAYMRARKMQTAARGRAAREAYKVARAAIVVLQRHGRGRPRRAEYGRMKVAALHLERIARGKKTRSWFKWYVEHLAILRAAATTVQARARGFAGRAAAQRAREAKAATAVAACARGAAARGVVRVLRRERAAVRVQAAQRGKVGRDGLAAARGAARAVQRAGRQRLWVVRAPPRGGGGAAADARPARAQVARPAKGVRRGQGRRVQGLLANATPRELLRSWGFAWAGGQRGVLRWLLTQGAAPLLFTEGGTHADAPPPPPGDRLWQAVLADACAINEQLTVCVHGPPTDARALLASGCPADVVGPGGRPAVALACVSGQPLVAALLVLYGAPVPTRDGAWAGENGGGGGARRSGARRARGGADAARVQGRRDCRLRRGAHARDVVDRGAQPPRRRVACPHGGEERRRPHRRTSRCGTAASGSSRLPLHAPPPRLSGPPRLRRRRR